LDSDGRLDLLSASALAGAVDWQRGLNAQLGFAPYNSVASGTFPSQFFVNDLDGDGDRDVAIADAASDQLGWYENIDGQGG
ncbi:VCBS repeat-containing protein, partial [Klebsiella pneumoniae]|nr:VCBS repeat-containing protein [Klebsiella pneumoniae]